MALRRTLLALLVAAAAVTAAALALGRPGSGDPPVVPRDARALAIGSRPDSGPVAPGFVGFSIEYTSLFPFTGSDPARIDPVFVALVRGLNPGQRPVLRFGGDSTDWASWRVPGAPNPPGIRNRIGPLWVAVAAATARALDARMIMGVNLEADSRALAATMARALVRGIGSGHLAALELGNEPEVYGALPWYMTPSGVPVFGRPRSYGLDSYLADFRRIAAALPRGVPLAGPASGGEPWITGLGRYLSAQPRVRIATFHRYPLHRCFTAAGSPEYPTISNLLAPAAARGPAASLAPAIAAAHAHGVSLRVDELNSVSCRGKAGVSDTFTSSLWILDTLFALARAGADGVNIHTFENADYEPFGFARSAGRWEAQVKPLYYGLLAFTRAAPAGSRLLPTSVPGTPSLRTWATRSPDGTVRLTLINVSRRHPVTIVTRPPGPVGSATMERLRAPHLDARAGVTLGGQSFGRVTTTGTPAGDPRAVPVPAIDGRYVVRVPASTAAVLTLPRR